MAQYDIGKIMVEFGLNKFLGPADRSTNVGRPTAAPKQSYGSNILHSIGNIAHATASGVAHAATDGFTGLYHDVRDNLATRSAQHNLDVQNRIQQQQQDRLIRAYHEGRINKDQYRSGLKDLMKQGTQLSAEAARVAAMRRAGYGQVAGDYAKAAGTVLSVAAPFAGVAPRAFGLAAGAGKASRVAKGINAAVGSTVGAGKGIVGTSTIPRAAVSVASKAALRNPLVTQPVIQAGIDVPTEVSRGKYGKAALNAGLFATPTVLSAAKRIAPLLGARATEALYGKQGFFDAVKENGGPDMLKYLDELAGGSKEKADAIKTARILQQYNIDQAGGNAGQAGRHWVQSLIEDGIDPASATPEELLKHAKQWIKAHGIIQKAAKEGRVVGKDGAPVVLGEGEQLYAARANAKEIAALRNAWANTTSPEQRAAILTEIIKANPEFSKNTRLVNRLYKVAESGNWRVGLNPNKLPQAGAGSKVYRIVQRGEAGEQGRSIKLPQGYSVSTSKNIRASVKPVEQTAELERGTKGTPGVRILGAMLKKAGLSTESQDPTVFAKWRANLNDELKKVEGLRMDANAVLEGLQKHNEGISLKGLGILDERQMTTTGIKDALDVSHTQANAIRKSILRAYDRLSLSEAGLANKVQNKLYKVPLYKQFSRAQNTFRYELNPFFRLQTYVETEALSQLQAKGKVLNAPGVEAINRIFGGKKQQDALDDAVRALKRENFFRGSGFGTLSAQDNNFGKVSAQLSRTQERSLAGLIMSMARKENKQVDEFIRAADKDAIDAVRAVVQYPTRGFTSSNFAKALNLAVFPSRYSIKIAGVLGKALADAPSGVQIATMKGLIDLASFLNSDEGIRWQKENSELIGIFNYFNPATNLKFLFNALRGEDVRIGDIGQIGGLPFGFIGGLLQKNHVIPRTDTPYIHPKTGEVIPDKIPVGLSGQIKSALADLVNAMYSFPGGTFGFGPELRKDKITQAVLTPVGANLNKGDVRTETRTDLTENQLRKKQLLAAPQAASEAPRTVVAPKRGTVPIIKRVELQTPLPKKKKGRTQRGKTYAKRRGQDGF